MIECLSLYCRRLIVILAVMAAIASLERSMLPQRGVNVQLTTLADR